MIPFLDADRRKLEWEATCAILAGGGYGDLEAVTEAQTLAHQVVANYLTHLDNLKGDEDWKDRKVGSVDLAGFEYSPGDMLNRLINLLINFAQDLRKQRSPLKAPLVADQPLKAEPRYPPYLPGGYVVTSSSSLDYYHIQSKKDVGQFKVGQVYRCSPFPGNLKVTKVDVSQGAVTLQPTPGCSRCGSNLVTDQVQNRPGVGRACHSCYEMYQDVIPPGEDHPSWGDITLRGHKSFEKPIIPVLPHMVQHVRHGPPGIFSPEDWFEVEPPAADFSTYKVGQVWHVPNGPDVEVDKLDVDHEVVTLRLWGRSALEAQRSKVAADWSSPLGRNRPTGEYWCNYCRKPVGGKKHQCPHCKMDGVPVWRTKAPPPAVDAEPIGDCRGWRFCAPCDKRYDPKVSLYTAGNHPLCPRCYCTPASLPPGATLISKPAAKTECDNPLCHNPVHPGSPLCPRCFEDLAPGGGNAQNPAVSTAKGAFSGDDAVSPSASSSEDGPEENPRGCQCWDCGCRFTANRYELACPDCRAKRKALGKPPLLDPPGGKPAPSPKVGCIHCGSNLAIDQVQDRPGAGRSCRMCYAKWRKEGRTLKAPLVALGGTKMCARCSDLFGELLPSPDGNKFCQPCHRIVLKDYLPPCGCAYTSSGVKEHQAHLQAGRVHTAPPDDWEANPCQVPASKVWYAIGVSDTDSERGEVYTLLPNVYGYSTAAENARVQLGTPGSKVLEVHVQMAGHRCTAKGISTKGVSALKAPPSSPSDAFSPPSSAAADQPPEAGKCRDCMLFVTSLTTKPPCCAPDGGKPGTTDPTGSCAGYRARPA